MNQYQQRRVNPNNRSRGGQNNRFDNRKPQNTNQGTPDKTKKDKTENQEQNTKQKVEKHAPEKPSPKQETKAPAPTKNEQPKHHYHREHTNDQGHHDNSEQQEHPTGVKKFTGRCRLFVGNLPNDTSEDQFRALFTPYGELSEVFVNPSRGFGFVRLDTRQNAEAAKASLDGVQKKNRVLRVRFATHGAALKIKFLPTHVSNELLEEAFSNFGNVERAVVIVDDRGKPTGEGIVEFARKPAASQALMKINEGAFLLGASPRPVLVEPLEQKDEDDGYSEKFIMKNAYYHKERETEPRLAQHGSFEFEMAQKWKEVYRMEAEHKIKLQREMEQAIARLELEQEQALHEHQAMLLRQDLMRRQEELRKLEERQMEMAKRMEMKRQEEDMHRQEEERHRQEMMMRQQQEQEMRRRQMESRSGRGPAGPGMNEEFEMRGGNNRSMDRGGAGGRGNFNEMRGGRGMENRGGRGEFNEGEGSGNMGGGNMGGGGGGNMRRGGGGGGGGGNEQRGGAPPMQPPPAPPAALGLNRERQAGNQGGGGANQGEGNQGGANQGGANQGGGNQGGGNQGGGNQGGGNQGGGNGGNMRQSRFEQSAGNQGGFGGNNMGPGGNQGGNSGNMGNNSGANMGPGNNMPGRQMGGGGMNRRREGGPREEFFESKRPRF